MPETAAISTDQLLSDLGVLCAQPSTTGQINELEDTARVIAHLLRRVGLNVKTVPTAGAPVVLAWRNGSTLSRLVLYHHYDVAPSGPWSSWLHEPFQLAEREDILYGRGVAHGKGPLAAHIQALRVLLQDGADLPCGVVMIIEGEGLNGSPHLAEALEEYAEQFPADGCLAVAGEHNIHGIPLCYSGSKGLLRVRLSVRGAALPLPAGNAASVPNPVWRLIWALNNIKGEDEDIRINGFYDSVSGPVKNERTMLRKAALDEPGRLNTWQIPAFLFQMSGAALTRSEVTLPTCNISAFVSEPTTDIQAIPTAASAQLDFQLVPDQEPAAILTLLRRHLIEKSLEDIEVEELPGGYAAVRTEMDQPFVQSLQAAVAHVYGSDPDVLPLGTFAQPLHIITSQLNVPPGILGLARHTSALHGVNEQIPLDDLIRHSQVLTELLINGSKHFSQIELGY